jgi:hypothetical protein
MNYEKSGYNPNPDKPRLVGAGRQRPASIFNKERGTKIYHEDTKAQRIQNLLAAKRRKKHKEFRTFCVSCAFLRQIFLPF